MRQIWRFLPSTLARPNCCRSSTSDVGPTYRAQMAAISHWCCLSGYQRVALTVRDPSHGTSNTHNEVNRNLKMLWWHIGCKQQSRRSNLRSESPSKANWRRLTRRSANSVRTVLPWSGSWHTLGGTVMFSMSLTAVST